MSRGRVQFRHSCAAALCALAWASIAANAATLPELVEAGDTVSALARIASGGDVNARSADGTSALHWAAHRGDAELLQRLLQSGADPNVSNDYGATPLSVAAVEANSQIVEALLNAGADAEAPNAEGQTALMVVARTGHVETARLLLSHGADVNATEQWGGQSALMWAAAQRQPDMIEVLIEHGADVDARGRAHDWQRKVTAEPRIKIMHTGGFTPLLYAAREGCEVCVQALIAGGADIDLSDPYGITPLVLALLNRHFDVAGALIDGGADVNQWDWWGRSPLFVAIDLNPLPSSRRGDLPSLDNLSGLAVARMLLERGANVNMRLKQQPPMRQEPGDRGFTDGSPDALVINIGATAMHTAAKSSDDAAIALLLEYSADVTLPNVFGITPILAAAGVGHKYGIFKDYPTRGRYKTGDDAVTTMKVLLAEGADINDRTSQLAAEFQRAPMNGLTAAHGAAAEGWSVALQFLYDSGFDIDAASLDGTTPRDLAVLKERHEAVELLDRLLQATRPAPTGSR
jgi:ankyrin repeat protein